MSTNITIQSFSKFPHIKSAISTKEHGSMKKADNSIQHANLIKFAKSSGIRSIIVCMEQMHSGNVAIVESTHDLVISQTDALITNKKNIGLGVITADCLPILLFDPLHAAIGVVHAGSKGLLLNIIHNTISAMTKTYDTRPEDIHVAIGPYIKSKCYEVGEDYAAKFKKEFADFSDIVRSEEGKYFLDLKNVSLQCLTKEGILEANIEVSPYCTKCNGEQFFSYRRGDTSGRFVSVVSLV